MHLEKPTETMFHQNLLVVFTVFNSSCLALASLQEENATISVAAPPCQDSQQGIVRKV